MNATTLNPDLIAAFTSHRQQIAANYPQRYVRSPDATRALELARADIAAGKKRYPNSPRHSAAGAPFAGYGTKAMRWCESPADIGLRFVGYADKLARIDHTGWFTDEFQDSLVRGVVYQLPARNGRAVYVSGYDNPDNGAADNGGPAAIDFGTLWEGLPGGDYARDDRSSASDAANHADNLAERMAEKERDYNAAWQAGSAWAQEADEIIGDKFTLRQMLAERRQAKASGADYPTICEAVNGAIRNAIADIKSSHEKMARLAAGDGVGRESMHSFWTGDSDLRAAFNEGAGQVVLA